MSHIFRSGLPLFPPATCSQGQPGYMCAGPRYHHPDCVYSNPSIFGCVTAPDFFIESDFLSDGFFVRLEKHQHLVYKINGPFITSESFFKAIKGALQKLRAAVEEEPKAFERMAELAAIRDGGIDE